MEHAIRALSEEESRSGITSNMLSSSQSSNLYDGFFSAVQLVRAFSSFKESGVPSRFLLFSEDTWVDLEYQLFDELKAGFLSGKTTLEVTVDRRSYLFDFLRMVRIDSDTGRLNSIAWMDDRGCCFFPKIAVDDKSVLMPPPLLCRSPPGARKAELLDDSMEVSSDRWSGAKMLREDDKFYKVVEKLFLSGIKRFMPHTVVTSINRCSYSSISDNSRLLSFKLHKSSTMESRGDANVKFGWYGTSASTVGEILSHGFKLPNNEQLSHSAHGIGIHLSPPHNSYASSLISEADENGERHVILCRVIMGNSEEVEAGSKRDHPSSEAFDSGVDDLVNPKWFVVWGSHVSTHIIPEYIVSFKCSGHFQGLRRPMGVQKWPSVMNLPFWKLFAEIAKLLPVSKMQALEILYNQYKVGKISKEIFIRYLRSIAGDKLLISTIKNLKG